MGSGRAHTRARTRTYRHARVVRRPHKLKPPVPHADGRIRVPQLSALTPSHPHRHSLASPTRRIRPAPRAVPTSATPPVRWTVDAPRGAGRCASPLPPSGGSVASAHNPPAAASAPRGWPNPRLTPSHPPPPFSRTPHAPRAAFARLRGLSQRALSPSTLTQHEAMVTQQGRRGPIPTQQIAPETQQRRSRRSKSPQRRSNVDPDAANPTPTQQIAPETQQIADPDAARGHDHAARPTGPDADAANRPGDAPSGSALPTLRLCCSLQAPRPPHP